MIRTYAFKGDEVIGDYLSRKLDENGYEQVSNIALADAVFVHCFHTGAIEDVFFDDDGLIKEATAETYLINLSPSTPSLAREVSAVAAVNDLRCVEAPLALKDPLAPKGLQDAANLLVYVGGEAQDCDAVRDCLEVLADSIVRSGDNGSAQLAKVCHTIRQASDVIAAVEELALCHSFHHDVASYVAGEFPLYLTDEALLKLTRSVNAGDFTSGYTNALLMSDVVAAMAAADDANLILPQLEAALHILELFGVIGGADKGVAALALLYRDEAEGVAQGLDWSRAQEYYPAGEDDSGDVYDDEDFDFGDNIDYFSN